VEEVLKAIVDIMTTMAIPKDTAQMAIDFFFEPLLSVFWWIGDAIKTAFEGGIAG
jgi:hypothetical protein